MLLIKLKQFFKRCKETWRTTMVLTCNEWELIFVKGGDQTWEEGICYWSVSNPHIFLKNNLKGVLYWNNDSE